MEDQIASFTRNGISSPEPPRTFLDCKAVTLGDAMEGRFSGPKEIIMKLRVKWAVASAQPSKRVLVNSDGRNVRWVNYVDGVLAQRDICLASE